jgi:hypothetical protein
MNARLARVAVLVAFALTAGGCATYADRLREARVQFYGNQVEQSMTTLDKHIEKKRSDADVLKLDRAVVQLAAGRPREAEKTLREVRDSFDYLEQASAKDLVLSNLTDDTARAYSGEDYEKVLIRAFLALTNLMGDGGDATAYSLQVGDVQQRIIQNGAEASGENPKLAYKRVAFGAYLCGALREETHSNYDDVIRCSATVAEWEPSFSYGLKDLQRAQFGHHSEKGNGVLYVFTLVGRGPRKEEAVELPTTVALLVADRILSATGKHTLPPNIAPVKVPKIVLSPREFQGVEVAVAGQPVGVTDTITDVGQIAAQQCEALYPQTIARAVVRRVVKKGIIYTGKEIAGVENHSLLNVAMDVGGVVWEATESADTRCWGLLPDRIQVLRVELPAGDHRITLQPLGGYRRGQRHSVDVKIADGRNTYLLANFPEDHLVGNILVSQRQ